MLTTDGDTKMGRGGDNYVVGVVEDPVIFRGLVGSTPLSART